MPAFLSVEPYQMNPSDNRRELRLRLNNNFVCFHNNNHCSSPCSSDMPWRDQSLTCLLSFTARKCFLSRRNETWILDNGLKMVTESINCLIANITNVTFIELEWIWRVKWVNTTLLKLLFSSNCNFQPSINTVQLVDNCLDLNLYFSKNNIAKSFDLVAELSLSRARQTGVKLGER